MKSIFLSCVVLCFAGIVSAQPTRPVPQIQRVLIISIDGLRADVLLRADTPNLHGMAKRGSFSFWAQTVPTANTLPSHASMLTGLSVQRHGIDFNDERGTTRPFYPDAVTLFEVAKNSGLSTALVSGKSKFTSLAKPGTVDWLWVPDEKKSDDADVADHAGAILRLHRPQVMFVHFPGTDTAGHSKGWGSTEQIAVIEQVDQQVGMILNALDTAGVADSTMVLVTSDHGGSGRSHGANDVRSLHIPWIVVGPGLRKNYDLTLLRDLQINTTDTFATACYVLGLQPPADIDGKPIMQIAENYELMRDVKPTTLPTTTTAGGP